MAQEVFVSHCRYARGKAFLSFLKKKKRSVVYKELDPFPAQFCRKFQPIIDCVFNVGFLVFCGHKDCFSMLPSGEDDPLRAIVNYSLRSERPCKQQGLNC